MEKVPFFLLAAASSAIALFTQQGSLASLVAVPFARRVANALVSYLAYVEKTVWPLDLAVFYPLPASIPLWKGAAAAVFLAVLTGLAIWRLRRHPFLAVGWFWFLGMLVPVIGLVQVGRQAMADRYTYLPSIGLSLLVTWGALALVGERRRLRQVLAGVAVVAVGLLAVAARAQVHTWKDSLTLFRHALAVTEGNYVAHLNVAIALSRLEGDAQAELEAVQHFKEVLRLQPHLPEGHSALATALQKWGKPAEALPHAQRAVSLRPKRGRLRLTLATILGDLGRREEAIAELRKAVELTPALADAWYGLGALLQQEGRTDEALVAYSKALEANPGLDALYAPAATLVARKGDLVTAARLYEEAIRRKPTASAHFNLAITLERLGKPAEASRHYRQALLLDPTLEAARRRLGELR
ncbi:MAG TPA: hypothetical protein DD490_02995 [Acidobacteria bacterium]|nr:hypothetical protein [Acidobacteriota bacterium]